MIEEFQLYNTVTREELQFSVNHGPLWLDSINVGSVPGIDQTYNIPNQDGQQLRTTTFGTRTVTITAWVTNSGVMQQQKEQLNHFCNPKQPLHLYYNDYQLSFIPANSVQYAKTPRENNDTMCKFVITGEAYEPLWTTKSKIEFPSTYVEPMWAFPFVIPEEGMLFGVYQSRTSAQIDNKSLPVGCVITFEAFGNSVSKPKIILAQTQARLTLDKTLVNGEKVIIDTRLGHRKVTGYLPDESTYNAMKYIDPESVWITLQTGLNNLVYEAETNLPFLRTSISYQPLLLEVEQ